MHWQRLLFVLVSSVLTSGQWGYPIQGLGGCRGAEEKKSSCMWLTSDQVNAASGALDPVYLSEAYLYRELDHDQDGMEIEVPKTFILYFRKKTGNNLKWNLLEWQNQTLPTRTMVSTKSRKF